MTTVSVAWEAGADVVVAGSGVAGLTAALDCAAAGLRVLVLTKTAPGDGSTGWAQGGIAVVDETTGDTTAGHLADTVVAGAGLTDPVVAAAVVSQGPAAVRRLVARGARFDRDEDGEFLRTREGGHHADRIIHAGGDATGAEVQRALLHNDGLPAVLTGHVAVDVVTAADGTACGLTVLDDAGRLGLLRAGAVVLATGGSGRMYTTTTNPAVATADGLAMALRAGAVAADVEFVQFHPTALFVPTDRDGRRPLVSEAVRGAGATLVDGAGRPVMAGQHPLGDLAPRDVVALAITRRMARRPAGIDDHVFLDASGIARFARRFPTITAACRAAGIDPAADPIPVVPAAHYHCGGVDTDLDGRTAVRGLYAVGEVARTGLHGANRLASNSLLEGLVTGERAAAAIAADLRWPRLGRTEPPLLPVPTVVDPAESDRLRTAMSIGVGIGRDAVGLAAVTLPLPRPAGTEVRRAAVEAANLTTASAAVVAAARLRTESRGCHVRLDHPQRTLSWAQPIPVRLLDGRPVTGRLRAAVAS